MESVPTIFKRLTTSECLRVQAWASALRFEIEKASQSRKTGGSDAKDSSSLKDRLQIELEDNMRYFTWLAWKLISSSLDILCYTTWQLPNRINFLHASRYGSVFFDDHQFKAKLVDLPCIVESLKTTDRKTFYKTGEISQVCLSLQRCNLLFFSVFTL